MAGRVQRMVTERVRADLAGSLRARVAGPDAQERAREIWDSPGPRWFAPGDPIWTVHADASMFVGGIRALLLQSLHPLAMAGVAGHSGYRSDPWGRLQRTSTYLATTTFGPEPMALAAVARVRAIHERVRGRAPDGRAYAASDPHLLGWVHAAEADSFLASYRRFGAVPLTDAQEDRYVEQSGRVAARLGVLDPPRTVAELETVLAAYRPELAGTPQAREACRFLLWDPPLPLAARPGYAALATAAVALLPGWARAPLMLPWLPVAERALGLPVGHAATRVIRWAMAG